LVIVIEICLAFGGEMLEQEPGSLYGTAGYLYWVAILAASDDTDRASSVVRAKFESGLWANYEAKCRSGQSPR
jgi:hypothetical protein